LFSEAMTQRFFAQVLRIAEWQSLISESISPSMAP
jgi:hypothetical protein